MVNLSYELTLLLVGSIVSIEFIEAPVGVVRSVGMKPMMTRVKLMS